jgi:demethylmenaquinone methyltransferase/2-methoxy-6-polyprenyl-1,4-benzoquinol methylase
MFDRIAGVYDLMNSAMTAGLHHEWRQRAVTGRRSGRARTPSTSAAAPEISLELRRRIGPDGRGRSDFSEPMLELACRKSGEEGLPVEFGWADALTSYGDAGFDAVTIGFGARNLADLDKGLGDGACCARAAAVVILEITRPQRGEPLASFYSLWFDRLVPVIGSSRATRTPTAYLPNSVRTFPEPERLAAKIDSAGFTEIRWLLLAGGSSRSTARPSQMTRSSVPPQ